MKKKLVERKFYAYHMCKLRCFFLKSKINRKKSKKKDNTILSLNNQEGTKKNVVNS